MIWRRLSLTVLLLVAPAAVVVASTVEFQVDPAQRYERIRPIWDALNLWSPSFLLTPDGEPNTWYVETHPFLRRVVLMTATGGRPDYPQDEILKRDSTGALVLDFSNFDRFLDVLEPMNLTPIIVLGAIPFALAPENPHIGVFGSITDPPTDYDAWHDFVRDLVAHCVARYGRQEVLRWAWRLYTEPDNRDWWSGTKEEYFKLYDYTVAAIQQALPGATVGPGNILGEMEDHWGMEILDHVFADTNAYTGTVGTRIDFFTFSAYEHCQRDFPPLKKFKDRVARLKAKLRSYGALKTVALGIDEGQLLHDENGAYLWLGDGTEYGAAWQAAYQVFGIREGFDRIVQWGFSADGVKTPKYNVIEMLDKMKGQTRVAMRLVRDDRNYLSKAWQEIDGIASVSETQDTLSIFVYSHHKYRYPHLPALEDPQPVRIVITQLPFSASAVRLVHWLVDSTHSNFFNVWLEDSKDLPRVPYNGLGGSIYDAAITMNLERGGQAFWWHHRDKYLRIDDLEKAGPDTTLPVAADGSIAIDLGMRPHQVSLLVLVPDTVGGLEGGSSSAETLPMAFSVHPNPFSERVTFQISASAGPVRLQVFDLRGRRVYSRTRREPGRFHWTWTGRDTRGIPLPSAVYAVQVSQPGRQLVRKLLLVR